MDKDEEKKKKREKKAQTKKKKVLKVGGLWVDPASFPSFDGKEEDKPRQ